MMVTERIDANARRDDANVDGDDEQRNTRNRIGQFRKVFLATKYRLHHNLRKDDEDIKAQQIQRLLFISLFFSHILDSSHIPQNGLMNHLRDGGSENEYREQHYS